MLNNHPTPDSIELAIRFNQLKTIFFQARDNGSPLSVWLQQPQSSKYEKLIANLSYEAMKYFNEHKYLIDQEGNKLPPTGLTHQQIEEGIIATTPLALFEEILDSLRNEDLGAIDDLAVYFDHFSGFSAIIHRHIPHLTTIYKKFLGGFPDASNVIDDENQAISDYENSDVSPAYKKPTL